MWFARTVLLLIVIGTLWLLLRYVPFALSSYVFYTAIICALVAMVGFFRPLPVVWIQNRSFAGIALATAILVAVTSLLWPPKSQRAGEKATMLDHFLPEYEHREFHAVWVPSATEKSWRAVKDVTFADVPAFRVLMNIRMAAVGKFRERAAPGSAAILAGLARPGSGFFVLGETPGEEIVIGMAGRPWASETSALRTPEEFVAYAAPGSVRIAFNLRVASDGSGARISTETRIQGTDPVGVRTFAPYWCAVYPGSSIMRQAWLEAIALRAREALDLPRGDAGE